MAAPDPFTPTVRGLDEPDPVRTALRDAGPIARVPAPAGGPVWIVTEEALARDVLADPRIVKDPAWAPVGWDQRTAGLEPPASAQLSLTTLDGAAHGELRRAHAPLLSARRMQERSGRIAAIAHDLLDAIPPGPVDLMADFTTRYPLTVLFDLLDVPLDLLDRAAAACRGMVGGDLAGIGPAVGALMQVAGAALGDGRAGLAAELRSRLDAPEDDVRYLLFALLFAGQLTTDAALGFLLARVLDGDPAPAGELVDAVLHRHPPAPFTLWRFTTTEVELAGQRLPARAPVLVDIAGIHAHPDRSTGPDLAFGAGAHYCIGAQLARVELVALVEVLRTAFPGARLAVPYGELRQAGLGDIQGSRLTALPAVLRP